MNIKKRKYLCQLLCETYPELVINGGVVTLKQIQAWWETYKDAPDRRIGFPLWLIGESQYRGQKRGTYVLPFLTFEDSVDTKTWSNKSTKAQTQEIEQEGCDTMVVAVDEETEKKFKEFCFEAGIMINATKLIGSELFKEQKNG